MKTEKLSVKRCNGIAFSMCKCGFRKRPYASKCDKCLARARFLDHLADELFNHAPANLWISPHYIYELRLIAKYFR